MQVGSSRPFCNKHPKRYPLDESHEGAHCAVRRNLSICTRPVWQRYVVSGECMLNPHPRLSSGFLKSESLLARIVSAFRKDPLPFRRSRCHRTVSRPKRIPVAGGTFKTFKLACNNTIGNESAIASVTKWRCVSLESEHL